MSELPIPYEITVAQDMVTDPATTAPLSHQWQSKSAGSAWSNIQGATGATFITTDNQRGGYVRLIQKTTDGATGESNELEVTNILANNFVEGIQTPLWPQDSPPLTFRAAGGGIDASGKTVFFQTADDGWYIADDGIFSKWLFPVGSTTWPSFMTMPWGGSAFSDDGNYAVMMPGQHGDLLVSRAPGGSGQSGWVYTFKPQYTQVNTGTHYGYFSATVPGLITPATVFQQTMIKFGGLFRIRCTRTT